MRARNIKPGIFLNEILGQADPIYTVLFEGLWCMADREGRLEDRPLRIKAEVFPYRDGLDINGELTQLERWGFIQRYEVGSLRVIQVVNFDKHQNPHHTERKSELPGNTNGCSLTVDSPLDHGGNPADSLIPDSLIPDSRSAAKPRKPSRDKRASWKDVLDSEVVEATGEIRGFWPDSSRSQPKKGETVPATKWPEVARRLQKIKSDGGCIAICVEAARRFAQEFDQGGLWAKAAENFFGLSDDAPFHGYYQAEVFNRKQEVDLAS